MTRTHDIEEGKGDDFEGVSFCVAGQELVCLRERVGQTWVQIPAFPFVCLGVLLHFYAPDVQWEQRILLLSILLDRW